VLLLDLFCGAGGAARGFKDAGFTVVGIDLAPQPRYAGDDFIQGDALETLKRLIAGEVLVGRAGFYCLSDFAAIHASPPCQKYSVMRRGRWQDRSHPDLIDPTRALLIASGLPYIIENVEGAPLINPLLLCGSMFRLGTQQGSQLRRHRLFELSWRDRYPFVIPVCRHNDGKPIEVVEHGVLLRRPATIGVWGNSGGYSKRDNLHHYDTAARREAMGIMWMTQDELKEAIPPAYTDLLGRALIWWLNKRKAEESNVH
jgi:DNA (cytosine-5)-methyltransferase 1